MKTEILAPAGNEECAYAAINAGADAIYLGLKSFSARDSADNFDLEKLSSLCTYAAVLGVKIYVALNTVVKDSEVEAFICNVLAAHNAGASAIIIQDMWLGAIIKERYPQITLHLSTQAGVCNSYGALQAKEYGFSRVIAARETPLDQLAEISKIIECESFVQGALCTCFSGQCYFSSFVGGNSGNRGRCKQPCRKKYSWNRKGYEGLAYRLSLSDLCVGENISDLIKAGVCSFKIEGRLRRPEYVAAAVKYYKNLLSYCQTEQDKINLKRAYNRGNYTKGLPFGQDRSLISDKVNGHIGEFVGNVFAENKKYVCKSKTECQPGDGFKILRQGEEIGGAVYGEKINGGFTLKTNARLRNGDKAFLTTDSSLMQRLDLRDRKLDVKVKVKIAAGEKISVSIDDKTYISDEEVESAETGPLTNDDVCRCFLKTDIYPLKVDVTSEIAGNVFIPASKLNAVRRGAYKAFCDSFLDVDKTDYTPINYSVKRKNNKKTAVIAASLNGLKADIGILKVDDYSKPVELKLYNNFSGEKYLFVPPFMTDSEISSLSEICKSFDGIYCDGAWAQEFCLENDMQLFAGTGFNITNGLSLSRVKAKYIAISKELTISEAESLSAENTFYLTAGNIKLMDLIYCPFEKTCRECDQKKIYSLTDERSRIFPVRRYKTSACRFEVFNCADLVCENKFCGMLADCTLGLEEQVFDSIGDQNTLKKIYKNYTRGHSVNSVT